MEEIEAYFMALGHCVTRPMSVISSRHSKARVGGC
jgi:hypothetical protein